MNAMARHLFQLIQLLIWDPLYLPWDSAAFCDAILQMEDRESYFN